MNPEPLGWQDFTEAIALVAAVILWIAWRMKGRSWWKRTTKCVYGKHLLVERSYLIDPDDVELMLGNALIWSGAKERVCAWCKTPQVHLLPEWSEVLKVNGDWGYVLIEPEPTEGDVEWLSEVGAKW